ncbi:uncharacterized protein LOC108682157 [Hyalella azteca]|uniref:Uncharacterized protein LOC108682157 n=1 Tax=Hyalella azteca TaxID=294128 RepID=A0A8B7PMW9_HYAAZ|nr:uncharacterized protein LOC108682157 [Hyalella azteca]
MGVSAMVVLVLAVAGTAFGTGVISTTAGVSAATIGFGVTSASSATAATAATAALGVAGVGTAAVVGALAATAIARNVRNGRLRRDVSCAAGVGNPQLLLALAASADQLGCGQRLVCELQATDDQQLTPTELQILEIFGRDVRPLKASQMQKPASLYHYAAQVGSKAASTDVCAETFDLCPLDRAAIMDAYQRYSGAMALDL